MNERPARARPPATADDQERVLRERARHLAEVSLREVSDSVVEVLLCRVRDERYAVELKVLRSVQRSAGLTAVPCTSRQVAGILNVRGELVTVLDLASILGLGSPALPGVGGQVVLVDLQHACVGLLVDEVLGVERVSLDGLDGSFSGANYSRGVASGSIVVLNLEQLLATQSFDDLSEAI